MTLDDLKHAQRERLIFLDHCLTWRGAANRRDLMQRFGISMAQAALDVRLYRKLAPSPPTYDPVRKIYVAAARHTPLAPSDLIDAFDIFSDDDPDGFPTALPRPARVVDPRVVARLHQAMRAKCAIHICYTSMSSGVDAGQWIAPTHFSSDRESVHLRAYSYKHKQYRDYLPIRIDSGSTFTTRPLKAPIPADTDWHTRAVIWLRPKSTLSTAQAAAVRKEYGFTGRLLRVETRKALEFYFDRRWGLDSHGARLEREKTDYVPM